MKKFYSIIALASMMLTSVLSLTSCQKDELPTPQTTQTVQSQQSAVNTVSQSTATTTGSTTSKTGSQFKVEDTSFVLGTWTANIGGTEYRLVVSNPVKTDLLYFDEYQATLYVGEKAIGGIFSTTHLDYIGEFHTNGNNTDGKAMSQLYNCSFSENNLTEFNVESVVIGCNKVANHVRFVKQ